MEATASLVERKRREAAEELVQKAIELFDRDGFEATTVEAIAEEVGCSPRTFYRYFGTKEDVVFYDVPASIERLGELLDGHLAEGMGLWPAVSEATMDLLRRVNDPRQGQPVRPIELWLREPALRARYMQHLAAAEGVIVESIARHRGTDPDTDDLAHQMGIAAIGAYRTVVTTHGPDGGSNELAKELRTLLERYGRGLDST
jgi:TetR/AcrR family transcriptional regulator, regulator of mycofactocin system